MRHLDGLTAFWLIMGGVSVLSGFFKGLADEYATTPPIMWWGGWIVVALCLSSLI